MKNCFLLLLFICTAGSANAIQDPVAFIKDKPYTQVVKDMVLARCIAQVSEPGSAFSRDAAHTANALRVWIPFDIENGDKKINALIKQFKDTVNPSHSEYDQKSTGLTLNCLRLYHSPELDKAARDVLFENPDHTWNQDNPDK
ncbi:T6SS amidase immunity protein Tai4 family protein [Cronobacter turicensis]|jgi:hypothetical protein|uniref:T6SS amidase immunity protein Tai4 family protein n=1 Tax=Cronobacter turicensis TaxID=413502 RepID=UPI0024C44C6B|nr:T6SS amidase immunity protein Tai4 family protein [Cronobacter turicensis]EKM5066154.1 hypothetical protein [Cronobacter turicensis]EKY3195628.1 hypothetical protein [Cronobacter turicensis]ELY3838130.1 hypothetical protein [Cronobacter turicensis]ELY4132288.1 hypothetical protein [Cronobacter turicensis]ELY4351996.1 hypothetical protein [Cronobacter turicensis]